jgi:thioredoxin-dependent peroxiredoxin
MRRFPLPPRRLRLAIAMALVGLVVAVGLWSRSRGDDSVAALAVGDKAPLFQAPLGDGGTFDMADHLGKKAIVIFFYPKDDTPLCTQEACGFRDAYEQFVAAGAEVVGVSADTPASHAAFARKHKLPFPIVSDRDGRLRTLFGVPKLLGFLPGRVTYVIDRAGVVRLAFNSSFTAAGHVQQALDLVRRDAATP